jgi:Raf kinase inhibitor-like YbhB/YbcL family protein
MRALILGTALAATATPAFAEMILASTDVKAGSPMAVAQVFDGYGCTGKNISPSLSWSGEPAGTQSFAVTMFDSDARNGVGWWHWTAFNIPASVHGLPAGAGNDRLAGLPPGTIQGRTDFGSAGYSGPCPPPGEHAHHYEITVYALRVPTLPLNANAAGAEVIASLKTNALATANIVGRYGR